MCVGGGGGAASRSKWKFRVGLSARPMRDSRQPTLANKTLKFGTQSSKSNSNISTVIVIVVRHSKVIIIRNK